MCHPAVSRVNAYEMGNDMPVSTIDGPRSPLFRAVSLAGNTTFSALAGPRSPLGEDMKDQLKHAPRGECVAWGMPFTVGRPLVAKDAPAETDFTPFRARSLVFMHTTDRKPLEWNRDGVHSPTRGTGCLGEAVADYVIRYTDGTEARHTLLRRHEIGMYWRHWGENCFQAVAHQKQRTLTPLTEQHEQPFPWGQTQTRTLVPDMMPWVNWIWSWRNPFPGKEIAGLRIEPRGEALVLSGLSAGRTESCPYRWEGRRKAVLRLPKGETFEPALDEMGLLKQVQLDLGQVISARPRTCYPDDTWAKTYNNQLPLVSENEVLVEYTAHPEARFHCPGRKPLPVAALEQAKGAGALTPVAPATQTVKIRVVEKGSRRPVAVKLHVHGAAGEYLAPNHRHRIPNTAWFEDYSADFVHEGLHDCTYIDGEAVFKLPLGRVYIEVSKGYEIKPVRKVVEITPGRRSITLTLSRVLPWRARGWVTADTHVHFLSPQTALLEGRAEGVNVVNLLASQWGELMTNVGDFDGKTTFGSREAGGDGEHLVRVGTENRQHVLGHISLLGYGGAMITPMTTGGPDESAIGDPVEVLLTEWARQCHRQGGLVVIPHFPNPRCENAVTLIEGDADAVEMTSWGNIHGGIDPYSLSDWYRYLNCGYAVPAVAGTDKMSADTPVGAIRTYARITDGDPFTYENWMAAVRRGETFVTYGPLLEFTVDGHPAGNTIAVGHHGGTVTVNYRLASCTVPMTRVDLVVNGEIAESRTVKPWAAEGYWTCALEKSAWMALLVRGRYPDKPEIIAAHSSPVMVHVEGSVLSSATDALTILEQIEGAMAYLETLGTRADDAARKRMRLVLTAAHRRLHNQMHQRGQYHRHTPAENHGEHDNGA